MGCSVACFSISADRLLATRCRSGLESNSRNAKSRSDGLVMRHVSIGLLMLGALTATGASAMSFGEARAQSTTKSSAPIRGVVRALNQASIAIDLPARVLKLHFREAQSFRKGDTLVTFDCKRIRAEHAAAAAASREMRLTLQSQTYLDARGAVGKLDVEISKARADKAEAEAEAIAARLEQCNILAPFDGRITELKINEHEVPANGQPFISIVDEAHFEIDLILPSHSLRLLEPGAPLRFRVDETGASYDGTLLRIGAAVDPVSQTIKAIAAFDAPDRRIVSGMSGTATISLLDALQ